MKFKQLFASITLSLIVFSSVVAQSPNTQDSTTQDATKKEEQQKAKEEREKKALASVEEIVKESQSLKLAENRMRLQAGAADLLWTRDEKRARALFKEVIGKYLEIMSKVDANAQSSSSPNLVSGVIPYMNANNPAMMIWTRSQLRQEILQKLMRHDVKWGREFLRQSRLATGPNATQAEMSNFETMLDMQFATQLAESEPKQAYEIAQENFDSAFSTGQHDSLINIMQQFINKDHEAAAKMASDILKKFRSENLASNNSMTNAAFNFLKAVTQQSKDGSTQKQPASKDASPLLDEASLRDLVEMIASAVLTKNKESSDDEDSDDDDVDLMAIENLIPYAEKYAPSRANALRAKVKEMAKSIDPEERVWSEIMSRGEDATADEIMHAAAKLPAEAQSGLYWSAAQKAIKEGNTDRARQIANENITNAEQRNALLAEIERQGLTNAVAQGKLEEVRRMLAQVESPEARVLVLSQLAAAISEKGDRKIALQLIEEVRTLVGNQPENAAQFTALVDIARTAAFIDAAQSFEILEGMIDQLNTIIAATAILDGFENRQQFKEGEMSLRGVGIINNLFQYWSSDLQMLARKDFDRARAATERFQRSEVRLMVQLSIAEGVLSDKAESIGYPGRRSLMQNVIQYR
ncbi:MAG: hypothetical protein WBV94_14870 [Blastocatellia bacterium]